MWDPRACHGGTHVSTLEREAFRRWPDVLREHGKVPDEAGPLLAALRDRGARLGIVTGSGLASLEPLRAGGLLDLFDAVITSHDVRRPAHAARLPPPRRRRTTCR